MAAIHFDKLPGVWNRRSIRWPDGTEDRSTRVWWLQARSDYVDIRLPANRPSFAGIQCLADCSDMHRKWLERQQGFAGRLAQSNDAWLWNREIDYQPPTGKRDIGTLQFTDSESKFLLENGVDEPYAEVWERVDDGASTNRESLVLRLQNNSAGERGILAALGNHFLMAVDRRNAMADQNIDLLDMEISYGLRSGPLAGWTVTDSTFPWREGRKIFDGSRVIVDWNRRIVSESKIWSIIEPAASRLDWVS
jgi:Protein HRI1